MMQAVQRPLILVTNDDGVYARGIRALADMVKPYGDVLVVAPRDAHSGMSHAITVKTPLTLKKIHHEEGLTIYKSNGTPVDCVKLALNILVDRKPAVCVSGINHGSNSSVSVHYSGTLGAAREAAFYGIPSIGFSLMSYDAEADFTDSVAAFKPIFEHVLANGLDANCYLNVNAPYQVPIQGVKFCRQTAGHWNEAFYERQDPRGETYYWLTGHLQNQEPEADDTCEHALAHGYVSVVPCVIDVTHFGVLRDLQSKLSSR
ncbi:MAG: 5'/3'-nucleotidase SurE [Marinilabiliaceae bacterium]|nr:5'/3'-nucleotidase SurE [Marinilabiliaceae bacterium]